MDHRIAITALVLSGTLACNKAKPEEQATPEQAPLPSAAVQAPTEPAPEPTPAPTAIPEAELQALLDAWLAAQNDGDPEAYDALYAAKFFGVKRAGQRETRFDRASWMSDRQRMFQKPMKVEAREPKFRASSASADIELLQHWQSGTFEDLGPKRLLVVREAGQLKIAQEEMLSSELVEKQAEQAPLDFYFILELDSGLYLSLPGEKVPEQLGPLQNENSGSDTGLYTVSRTVDDKDLDARVSALKSKNVQVEGGCVATISGFRAVTRVIPHFGERQRWTGQSDSEDPPSTPSTPFTPEQIAQAASALAPPQLFAALSGCSEGRYARLEGSQPPLAAVLLTEQDAPSIADRARTAFAKLPSVATHQKAYAAESSQKDRKWWDGHLKVSVFKHPESGQVLVSALAVVREGCEDFSASEWAVFEQKGNTLARIPLTQSAPDKIKGAVDADGDGRLELLGADDFGTDVMLIWPDADKQGAALGYTYLDCPC